MSTSKKFMYYIPENLDIDSLLVHNPPPDKVVEKNDIIQHIDTLLTAPIYNSDNIGEDGSFPLSSKKLQGICHHYKAVLTYLEEVCVIECTRNYYTDNKGGGECRRYRFCDKYIAFPKPIHIEFKKLPKNLVEKKRKGDGKRRNAGKAYPHLTKHLKKKYLRVDYEGAIEYLKIIFNSESRRGQTKIIAALANLYNIKTKNFYYSVDNTGNRLHSNLTNLPKELRKFIYCVMPGSDQKYPLEAVDLKNSQPFFASIIFNNPLINSSINNHHIIPPLLLPNIYNNYVLNIYNTLYNTYAQYNVHSSVINNNKFPSIHYVSKKNNRKSIKRGNTANGERYWGNINDQYEDIKRFTELVSNGTFYEYLVEVYKRDGIDIQESFELYNIVYSKSESDCLKFKSDPRSNIKQICMLVFFSRNNDYQKLKEPFEKEFPNVYQTFQRIKECWWGCKVYKSGRVKKEKENPAESYKKLPALLQRFESHMILGVVCKRFSEKFPNVPVFTIHDNIAVPAYDNFSVNYIEELKAIIEEEFLKIIGVSPMVHDEQWRPKDLFNKSA